LENGSIAQSINWASQVEQSHVRLWHIASFYGDATNRSPLEWSGHSARRA